MVAGAPVLEPIPFDHSRLTAEQVSQRSAIATGLGLQAISMERQARKWNLMEWAGFALMVAMITAGILNGFWLGGSGVCRAPDPHAGLPAELQSVCDGAPEGKKPVFCEQKYIHTMDLAAKELQDAVASYQSIHTTALEDARLEVVHFYQERFADLNATLKQKERELAELDTAFEKSKILLATQRVTIGKQHEEYTRAMELSNLKEKEARDSKAKLQVLDAEVLSNNLRLAEYTQKMVNQTAVIKELQAKHTSMELALSKTEAALHSANTDKTKLEMSAAVAKQELQDVKSKLSDSKKEKAELAKAKEQVMSDLVKANNDVAKRLEAIKGLTSRNEELLLQKKELEDKLTDMTKQRDALARTAAALQEHVNALNSTLISTSNERDNTAALIEAKEKESKQLHAHVAELQGKLKNAEDAMQRQQARSQKELQESHAKLERAKLLFDDYLAHVGKVQAQLEKLAKFVRQSSNNVLQETNTIMDESKPHTNAVIKAMNDVRAALSS